MVRDLPNQKRGAALVAKLSVGIFRHERSLIMKKRLRSFLPDVLVPDGRVCANVVG